MAKMQAKATTAISLTTVTQNIYCFFK